MKKTLRPGTAPIYDSGPQRSVFLSVEISNDGRLSIFGVHGPTQSGNASSGCGQIIDTLKTVNNYAPGWNRALITRLVKVWDDWHLNDMRAGCEHQRKIDPCRKVEIVSYGLTTEASKLRTDAIDKAARTEALGERDKRPGLTNTERALILLDDWFKDRHSPPDADSPLSGCYEVRKRENKAIGWVTQDEHPDGMLSKPCEVCGYKYGTKWLHEDVPAEVVAFLASLPDTDQTPAWV